MKPLRRNFCIVLFICNANILIGAWRARMLFWRFKMTQIWNRHTNNLFSRFLALGTCTGRPRTHRTADDSPSSTQYDVRTACELWSQVCMSSNAPHTALAIYSHDQFTWLYLVDRPRAVVLLSSGPRVASKKFCKNRLSSCCPASSCNGYSMEEQLTNARLCHYIFNPLIKPWEWQILESGRTEDFVIEGSRDIV